MKEPIETQALPHRGTSVAVRLADGTSLRVIERSADGSPPFLLVHGLASNARLWDDVAGGLARAGHGSVAVDQRGHGLSDRPASGFDFPTLSADLAEVVRATVGRSVIAVGQSWGGNVVVEMAACHPDLVLALGLIDGGFIKLAATFPSWIEAKTALTPPPLAGLPFAELERGVRASMATFPESGIQAQLANFEVEDDGSISPRLGLQTHMTILRELWEHDPDEVVEGLNLPIHVIASRHGLPGKIGRVGRFVAAARNASVTWVDAHHDVHAELPSFVVDQLMPLTARVGS